MKVLWIGDAVISSGFSVVTHNICDELCKLVDLEVFGIRYDGKIRHNHPYHIYPGLLNHDMYSFGYARDVIIETKPDVVVVFNDDHVIEQYISASTENVRVVLMFPINLLPLDRKRIIRFEDSQILTYTEFAKEKIKEINPNLNVTVTYHGVQPKVFHPIAETKLNTGLQNNFIVGIVGSNTYRKRLDLFMIGFAKFAEGKKDVKCLIHATNDDMAYDLEIVAADLGIVDKTILSTSLRGFLDMSLLYNLMDVNVNTSLGEGFGLPLIEGAACRVPVLCAAHGNLVDIWGDNATYIDIKNEEYIAGTKTVGSVIDTDDYATKLTRFYEDVSWRKEMGRAALAHSQLDQFKWSNIAEKVYVAIQSANSSRISYIS